MSTTPQENENPPLTPRTRHKIVKQLPPDILAKLQDAILDTRKSRLEIYEEFELRDKYDISRNAFYRYAAYYASQLSFALAVGPDDRFSIEEYTHLARQVVQCKLIRLLADEKLDPLMFKHIVTAYKSFMDIYFKLTQYEPCAPPYIDTERIWEELERIHGEGTSQLTGSAPAPAPPPTRQSTPQQVTAISSAPPPVTLPSKNDNRESGEAAAACTTAMRSEQLDEQDRRQGIEQVRQRTTARYCGSNAIATLAETSRSTVASRQSAKR